MVAVLSLPAVHLALLIPCFALIALSLGAGVYYGVIYARILLTDRRVPNVRAGLSLPPPPGGWPRVCVVIPAHNEEQIIAHLARSLVAQRYPKLSIVFALDRCTDATERAVREACAVPASGSGELDPRVDIVIVNSCPEGWAGKTHAAWSGVQRGRGARDADLLIFADADTVFDANLIRSAAALVHHRQIDLLSLLSELTSETWWERLVQPAAGFELVRQYPLDRVNRAERPRAFANGQFMMFRRAFYDALGGHERVKADLLEDIAFARAAELAARAAPVRWNVLMPGKPGMLRCRMYRSYEAFRRGWKRIYTEASMRRPAQLREWAWRSRLMGSTLPPACAACAIAGPAVLWGAGDQPLGLSMMIAGAIGLCATMLALDRVYRDQGLPARWALAYPLGAWRVAAMLAEAAGDLESGTKTVWGGREYERKAQR